MRRRALLGLIPVTLLAAGCSESAAQAGDDGRILLYNEPDDRPSAGGCCLRFGEPDRSGGRGQLLGFLVCAVPS